MINVLKKRDFSLLWLGGLVSMIGNWMLMAALPFHVYQLTGSALATSGVLMAYIAPGILFSSLAGVLVDRWSRKRTMLFISLMQAAALMLMLLVQSPGQVWIFYVAIFLGSSLASFFSPAENALLPNLVGEEHLMAANSLNALNDNLGRLAGPAIGGALLGLAGFTSVVLVDSATFLFAALLILFVRAPQTISTGAPEHEAGSGLAGFWQEWAAGLRYIRGRRLLAATFIVMGIALFGDAILSAVLVVFVQADMKLGALEFGWMMTTRGIGGLLGGVLIAQLSSRWTPRQLIVTGLVFLAGLIVLMLSFPTLEIVLPLLVLAGFAVIAWIVSVQTLLQTGSEDAYRGRVFGSFGTTTTLLMFFGSALGGLFTDLSGAGTLMLGSAVIYLVAGVVAWRLLPAERPELLPVLVASG